LSAGMRLFWGRSYNGETFCGAGDILIRGAGDISNPWLSLLGRIFHEGDMVMWHRPSGRQGATGKNGYWAACPAQVVVADVDLMAARRRRIIATLLMQLPIPLRTRGLPNYHQYTCACASKQASTLLGEARFSPLLSVRPQTTDVV